MKKLWQFLVKADGGVKGPWKINNRRYLSTSVTSRRNQMWWWQHGGSRHSQSSPQVVSHGSQFILYLSSKLTNTYRMWSLLCQVCQVLKTDLKVPPPWFPRWLPRWWPAPPLGLPRSPRSHTSAQQHIFSVQWLKTYAKPDLVGKSAHLEGQFQGLHWLWWSMNGRQSNDIVSDVYLSVSMLGTKLCQWAEEA